MPYMLYETVEMNYGVAESRSRGLDRALAESRFVEAAKKGTPASGERPSVIYPQFHILTADKPTRNMTLYTTEAHKGSSKAKTGQHSFTRPYPIPLLTHHMSQPECGMPPSVEHGRMIDAKLVKDAATGQGHVAGLGEVTHPEGIDEIMTGRWLTGSLGSSVHDASCSVCGLAFSSPGAMSDHVHQRGQFYRPRDKKKDADKPVQHDYISGTEDLDWVQAAPTEKGAQQCYTMIGGYQAREYSKVHTPSDDQSVVTVADTNVMPGSHFTTDGQPISPDAGESEIPLTSLWVPMSASSRSNVSVWGERYIDLVTGRERKAEDGGFLFGHALHEHIERVLGGEDVAVLTESIGMADRVRVAPHTFRASEGYAPAADTPPAPADPPAAAPEAAGAEAAAAEAAPSADDDNNYGVFSGGFCGPNETYFVHSSSCVERGLRALPYAKNLSAFQKAKVRANLLTMARKHDWDLNNSPTQEKP